MYSHSFKCTVKNDKWWHAKVHVILNVFSKMKMKLNYLFLKILVSPFLWSFIKHTSSYFHSKWRRYLYWRKTLIVKWPLQHHKDQMRQLPTGNPPETHLACQGWWCQSPQRPLSQCDLWPDSVFTDGGGKKARGASKNQETTPIGTDNHPQNS